METAHRTVFLRPKGAAAVLLAACVMALGAAALVQAEPAAPGAPSLPRMPWGDPDIGGVWTFVLNGPVNPAAAVDIVHGPPQECIDIASKGTTPVEYLRWPRSLVEGTADGEVPYQPWAKAKRAERLSKVKDPASEDFISTSGRCLLAGMPATMFRLNPHVQQFRDHILMLWEYPQMHRIIWTDGRSPPPPEIKLWQGFSVGHWEGDTLVVTTTNQSGFSWLDGTGNLMSENTKTTEYIKAGATSIAYKIVIDDPTAYTQSWWMEWRLNILKPGARQPDAVAGKVGLDSFNTPQTRMAMTNGEILEVACVEGERHHVLAILPKPASSKAKRPAALSKP